MYVYIFTPTNRIRVRKLYFSVDTPRTKEGVVEDVYSVGGHEHRDVLCGLKAIQLIQQLQHRTLHLWGRKKVKRERETKRKKKAKGRKEWKKRKKNRER